MFNTIDEVYNWLFFQKKLKKREDLTRIKYCIKKLNLNPTYKIIHITGTNGKGSVATFIKNILKNTNMHVGLFISPFIISFNERIQINDRYISDAEIMHYSNILYEFSNEYRKNTNDIIPFFELTLLMALMFFKDRNIDLAVIECGLGGLLDSTNFVNSNLSIITNVGYDHMAQLGNTLDEIANHKLGIIKNNQVCLTAADLSFKNKFDNYAKNLNSKVIFVNNDVSDIKVSDYTYFKYKGISYKTNLLGEYQAYNASLAIEAINQMYKNISYDLIDYGLSNTFHPGRLEIIKKDPLIIIDGAHNISAITALTNSIKKIYPNKKIKIVFTALHDKAYKEMINILDNISTFYYFTSINDLRATDVNEFNDLTKIAHKSIQNMNECINEAINNVKEDELLLITGSLHFISQVRNIIK